MSRTTRGIIYKSEAERRFMIVYAFMVLAFLAAGISAEAVFPTVLGTVPEIIFCWGLCRFRKGSSASRAVIMTVSGLVSMTFFGVMVLSMDILVPLFAIMLAMIGMFNSSLLLGLWAADTALMFLYHLFVRKSYDFSSQDGFLRIFYQLFCLSLMLYLEKAMIRKNLERKRRMWELVEFLQESERGKDGFLCGYLRALKEPLDRIGDKSGLILKEDLPREVRDAAESILASGRRIWETAEDMSDYVEGGNGKGASGEAAYDLAPMLADVRDIIIAQNMGRNPDISVNCDENVPEALVGDSDRVRKAILCLMNNAMKFAGRDSVSLQVSAQKKNYGVDLCVSVQGMGSSFCIVIPQKTADGQKVD